MGLDAIDRQYDHVVNDPTITEHKNDTGSARILAASEAESFRGKYEASCFSSNQLDVKPSILWILGEQIGIHRSFLSNIGPVVVGNFNSLRI